MNKSAFFRPTSLTQNNNSTADPIKIANSFNNFLSTIAARTESKIKFSSKHFFEFLKANNSDTSFYLLSK